MVPHFTAIPPASPVPCAGQGSRPGGCWPPPHGLWPQPARALCPCMGRSHWGFIGTSALSGQSNATRSWSQAQLLPEVPPQGLVPGQGLVQPPLRLNRYGLSTSKLNCVIGRINAKWYFSNGSAASMASCGAWSVPLVPPRTDTSTLSVFSVYSGKESCVPAHRPAWGPGESSQRQLAFFGCIKN